MRARSSCEAAAERIHAALHAPSRWGQSLKQCVVQTPWVWAGMQQSRQNTWPETADARTNAAEKIVHIRSQGTAVS